MLDKGFRPGPVGTPGPDGHVPITRWESDLPFEEAAAAGRECRAAYGPAPIEKTDAEVHEIYDQWVKERDCLVGLGYSPTEPPTFEKFLADWNGSGPWMPIDGVDTSTWTGAQYDAAKNACTLEFYSRD